MYSSHCVISAFFFSSRRRHTRLQGDWSSDVCSSDLVALEPVVAVSPGGLAGAGPGLAGGGGQAGVGRAAGRGRGEISGGGASFKKKKQIRVGFRYSQWLMSLLLGVWSSG